MFDVDAADRGVSPVLGSVLLLVIVLVLAAVIGTTVADVGDAAVETPTDPRAMSVTADASGRVTLVHEGGPPIDVAAVEVRVRIDGRPLARQPPIPFFSASGFSPGPTGPFNSASDDEWSVGEAGSFTIAGTNAPAVVPGSTIAVTIVDDGGTVARATASVSGNAGDGDEG
ncbi:MAG: type IV pilin [Halanaeroarchaeum sp.]